MTLNYYTKQNYGVEVMYLAKPAMAQAWYRMTGKKTINSTDMDEWKTIVPELEFVRVFESETN